MTTCKACSGPIGRAGDKARGLCSRCAFENPEPLALAGLPLPPSQFTAAGFAPQATPSGHGRAARAKSSPSKTPR